VLRVALTGGIATGKTYVRRRLAARGVPTIDADTTAREVVEPGTPGLAAIAAQFGPGVLDASGALDRAALGRIVFGDAGARRKLEAIVHPAVYGAIGHWLARVQRSGSLAMAVADIPLLFETGRQGDFDVVVVAACDAATQLARLVARDRIPADEARLRIAAQWPIADKTRLADFVIDTGGTFEDTDRQVDEVYDALAKRAAARS
jgi:dephospho-CoA kinase